MRDGWGMGWMWLAWPLVILGAILVVVILARLISRSGNGGEAATPGEADRGQSRAKDILDERYARGELTDEEYQQRLRNLRGESGR